MREANIERLRNLLRNWPKRCVILGADGDQWPFMKGTGHDRLEAVIRQVGRSSVRQAAPMLHGR
eukprot:5813746-Alexandrium_andersonii.AAC.1